MMGYYGYANGYSDFHAFGGYGIICAVISVVVLIDLVLLGLWLWKRIEKESKHHNN